MARPDSGGRKTPHDLALRERAVEIALRWDAATASRKTGIASGTIRSWVRRRQLKEQAERSSDGVIERLIAEGEAMLAERERRQATEANQLAPEEPQQPPPSPGFTA